VKRSHAKPRYLQVADALIASIRKSSFAVGDFLPTELQLCERFEISRHTAREALRVLSQMGLVDRRRGSGTRVVATHSPVQYRQFVQSIDDLLQYGESTRLVLHSIDRGEPPDYLVQQLGLNPMLPMVHMLGLRHQRDREFPLCLTEIWVPEGDGKKSADMLDTQTAVFALMERLNVRRLARVEQSLEAENLDAPRAGLLGVSEGTAALRIERRYFGPRDELLAMAISTHPKDRFTYSTVLTRGAQ